MFRHGDRLRRGRDLQCLGQVRLEGGIDLQGGSRIPSCQEHAHEAPGGLFRKPIERHPPREGDAGRLKLPGGFLPEGEPIQQQEQAHLPLALLLLAPRVKGSVLPQPEAVEEGTAHQGEGTLDEGDQRGMVLLRGEHGELVCFLPGV